MDRIEDWLRGLGCTRGACPNEFACIWHPPGARPPFLAPNPARCPAVPVQQARLLADIVSEIMGIGTALP